jgi:hypothetical protein
LLQYGRNIARVHLRSSRRARLVFGPAPATIVSTFALGGNFATLCMASSASHSAGSAVRRRDMVARQRVPDLSKDEFYVIGRDGQC